MLALTGLNRIRSSANQPSRTPAYILSTLSTYDLDFVGNSYKGGTMNFSNNNNDGRLYRQYFSYVSRFALNSSGVYEAQASSNLRRTDMGLWIEQDRTNIVLYNRDLTNAAWAKTNMTAAKTQTGVTGVANSASSLTATAANATILQPITLTARTCFSSFFVKRLSGSGTFEYTLDGGTTWISSAVTSGWTRVSIGSATLTNPSVGFRIGTSGDSFAVDFVQIEYNATYPANTISNPIATTTAAVQTWGDRASCAVADANALGELQQGAFGFYIEASLLRLESCGLFVSDGFFQIRVNADGSVQAVGNATGPGTPAGSFVRGLNAINKVAGYMDATGNMKISCNGSAVVANPSNQLSPSLTHVDLGTNGSGAMCIHGVVRRLSFFNAGVLTDADLRAITA